MQPYDTDFKATHKSVSCVRGHPWHPIILTSCPALAFTEIENCYTCNLCPHTCTIIHVYASA